MERANHLNMNTIYLLAKEGDIISSANLKTLSCIGRTYN